jgi:hypothetical protein
MASPESPSRCIAGLLHALRLRLTAATFLLKDSAYPRDSHKSPTLAFTSPRAYAKLRLRSCILHDLVIRCRRLHQLRAVAREVRLFHRLDGCYVASLDLREGGAGRRGGGGENETHRALRCSLTIWHNISGT